MAKLRSKRFYIESSPLSSFSFTVKPVSEVHDTSMQSAGTWNPYRT